MVMSIPLKSEMHPLLSPKTIEALRSKHITTVLRFLENEIGHVASATGLTYKNIVVIRKHLINKSLGPAWKGHDYYCLKKVAPIPTGSKNLDDLLGAGLVAGKLYEVCGLPASGKTQLCFSMAANAARTLDHRVYYLDTKGDFSAKRVKQILESQEGASEDAAIGWMLKILVKRTNTIHELLNSLHAIKDEIVRGSRVSVLIIDSLPTLIYGSAGVATKYGLLHQCVNVMRYLASEHQVVFVVTNLVTNWYVGDLGRQTRTEKVGLGGYWFGVPDTRLMVRREIGSNGLLVFIMDSLQCSRGKSCLAQITDKGVT